MDRISRYFESLSKREKILITVFVMLVMILAYTLVLPPIPREAHSYEEEDYGANVEKIYGEREVEEIIDEFVEDVQGQGQIIERRKEGVLDDQRIFLEYTITVEGGEFPDPQVLHHPEIKEIEVSSKGTMTVLFRFPIDGREKFLENPKPPQIQEKPENQKEAQGTPVVEGSKTKGQSPEKPLKKPVSKGKGTKKKTVEAVPEKGNSSPPTVSEESLNRPENLPKTPETMTMLPEDFIMEISGFQSDFQVLKLEDLSYRIIYRKGETIIPESVDISVQLPVQCEKVVVEVSDELGWSAEVIGNHGLYQMRDVHGEEGKIEITLGPGERLERLVYIPRDTVGAIFIGPNIELTLR